MAIPKNLDKRIADALQFFWATRAMQIERQNTAGTHDQGNRGAVTGGKQLDGFVNMTKDILVSEGLPEGCIFTDTDLELPGYFRPNKKWDLLVVKDGRLLSAIEFKSQTGPSFGNNFNNRTEEAMGSALDIWTAYREGVFGIQNVPWLGYFFVLEDCDCSSAPVKVRSPHFSVLEEFLDASYKKRYELFCSKLLLERQYSAACFITTSINEAGNIAFCCPNEALSYKAFIKSLTAYTAVYADMKE